MSNLSIERCASSRCISDRVKCSREQKEVKEMEGTNALGNARNPMKADPAVFSGSQHKESVRRETPYQREKRENKNRGLAYRISSLVVMPLREVEEKSGKYAGAMYAKSVHKTLYGAIAEEAVEANKELPALQSKIEALRRAELMKAVSEGGVYREEHDQSLELRGKKMEFRALGYRVAKLRQINDEITPPRK